MQRPTADEGIKGIIDDGRAGRGVWIAAHFTWEQIEPIKNGGLIRAGRGGRRSAISGRQLLAAHIIFADILRKSAHLLVGAVRLVIIPRRLTGYPKSAKQHAGDQKDDRKLRQSK